MARAEQRQSAADHDRGVLFGGHEDMRCHRGGSRFAVRAGDAKGVLVGFHDGAPGLRALKNGDGAGNGSGDLGIVVMDGGGADDKVALTQVVRCVSDGDGDAKRAKMLHCGAFAHIAALHGKAHGEEFFRQRAHRHAADARKMHALAALQIRFN